MILAAAEDAQSYSANAYTYITDLSGPGDRYTTWFGSYDKCRKSTVQLHFGLINGWDFSQFTYDCTCTDAATYAYVCAYMSKSRSCCSATDKGLEQIPTSSERSTSAAPSGMPLRPARIRRLGRSSTSLRTSRPTVGRTTTLTVTRNRRAWRSATLVRRSSTRTATNTSPRTSLSNPVRMIVVPATASPCSFNCLFQ